MSVRLMGQCPRPDCHGAIMADGVCHLCNRPLEAPVPALPLLNGHQGQGGGRPRKHAAHEAVADPSLWCVKCRVGQCRRCGGQRLEDTPMGMVLVPCECPHHGEVRV